MHMIMRMIGSTISAPFETSARNEYAIKRLNEARVMRSEAPFGAGGGSTGADGCPSLPTDDCDEPIFGDFNGLKYCCFGDVSCLFISCPNLNDESFEFDSRTANIKT